MKLVILMRGLPGSGKSTVARSLMYSPAPNESFVNPTIVSTDDFWMRNGKYNYVAKAIGKAHMWCRSKFEAAVKHKDSIIIVDNTNIKMEYMKPYMEMARKAGYVVVTMTVEDFNVAKLFKRNSHGVPKDTIARMAEEFQR